MAALVLADPPSLREQSPESSCGGSCFWMLGRVAYCTTLLRWRPGTVRGFDSLSIRSPWLAVKSHFFAIGFPYGGLG